MFKNTSWDNDDREFECSGSKRARRKQYSTSTAPNFLGLGVNFASIDERHGEKYDSLSWEMESQSQASLGCLRSSIRFFGQIVNFVADFRSKLCRCNSSDRQPFIIGANERLRRRRINANPSGMTIILSGQPRSGKTSLLYRLKLHDFIPTVGHLRPTLPFACFFLRADSNDVSRN